MATRKGQLHYERGIETSHFRPFDFGTPRPVMDYFRSPVGLRNFRHEGGKSAIPGA